MIIRFALDMISGQLKKTIITLMMVTTSVLLLMFSVMVYEWRGYAYNSADRILKAGVNDTAIIEIDVEDFADDEIINEYVEAVYDRKEVDCFGGYQLGGTSDWTGGDLLKIQKNHAFNNDYSDDDLLEVANINKGTLNLCELKIKNRVDPKQFDYNNEVIYWFLGSAYPEEMIGREYQIGGGYIVKIAGVLEEDQMFIKEELGFLEGTDVLEYSIDCDYMIFQLENNLDSNLLWLSASGDHSVDDAIGAALEEADRMGIKIYSSKLSKMFEEVDNDTKILMNILLRIIFIILISAIVIMTVLQLTIMLEEAKQYGIMYAIGFSRGQISSMLLIKYIIIAGLAFALAIPSSIYISAKFFGGTEVEYIIRTIYIKYAVPAGIVLLISQVVVVFLITDIILSKSTPVKLLKSKISY